MTIPLTTPHDLLAAGNSAVQQHLPEAAEISQRRGQAAVMKDRARRIDGRVHVLLGTDPGPDQG